MTDFTAWHGGTNGPDCQSRGEAGGRIPYTKAVYPVTVADHFQRTVKGVSQTFAPMTTMYLQEWLKRTTLAAGDRMGLILVPTEHNMKSLFIKTQKAVLLYGPDGPPAPDNSAGFQWSIQLDHVTSVDDTSTNPVTPKGTVLANATIVPARAIDDESLFVAEAALPTWAQFVPQDTAVIISLVFSALPTGPNVKMDQFSGFIGLCANIGENPIAQSL